MRKSRFVVCEADETTKSIIVINKVPAFRSALPSRRSNSTQVSSSRREAGRKKAVGDDRQLLVGWLANRVHGKKPQKRQLSCTPQRIDAQHAYLQSPASGYMRISACRRSITIRMGPSGSGRCGWHRQTPCTTRQTRYRCPISV